jgi:hypothetical protein
MATINVISTHINVGVVVINGIGDAVGVNSAVVQIGRRVDTKSMRNTKNPGSLISSNKWDGHVHQTISNNRVRAIILPLLINRL